MELAGKERENKVTGLRIKIRNIIRTKSSQTAEPLLRIKREENAEKTTCLIAFL